MRHGPVAVVWHDGRGRNRKHFDTVIELIDDSTIESRTYQKGVVVPKSLVGQTKPGKACWRDIWRKDECVGCRQPSLDGVVELLTGVQSHRLLKGLRRPVFRVEDCAGNE